MRILLSLLFVCFGLSMHAQKVMPKAVEQKVEINDEFLRYFEGTVIIDGERSNVKVLQEIPKDRIESMELHKGAIVRERFHITHNQGVLEVITKK